MITKNYVLTNRLSSRDVLLMAEHLELGHSEYTSCPACGRDGKFSVTRTSTGVLYHCFRDVCGVRGHAGATGAIPQKLRNKETRYAKFEPKYFDLPTRRLSGIERAAMFARFELSRDAMEKADWRYCEQRQCYVFPVKSRHGYTRGMVARYYHKRFYKDKELPKAVAYKEVDGPWLSWYTRDIKTKCLVLVEDQVSALKASEYVDCVALLGTNIDEREAMEIAQHKAEHVIVALDADAINSAHKLKRQFGLLWQSVSVMELQRDLKDEKHERLAEMFSV